MREKLAGLAHGGRVHDGHHFFDVVNNHAVEQLFVPILQGGEEDVLFQVVRFAPKILHDLPDLLILGEDGILMLTNKEIRDVPLKLLLWSLKHAHLLSPDHHQ